MWNNQNAAKTVVWVLRPRPGCCNSQQLDRAHFVKGSAEVHSSAVTVQPAATHCKHVPTTATSKQHMAAKSTLTCTNLNPNSSWISLHIRQTHILTVDLCYSTRYFIEKRANATSPLGLLSGLMGSDCWLYLSGPPISSDGHQRVFLSRRRAHTPC